MLVPIVVPFGVTVTSLLLNAKSDTFYDIYVLHDEKSLPVEACNKLECAFSDRHCNLSFVNVGDAYFDTNLNSNGHITRATYYRLLIPSLFPQFEKVLYADVDMIMQQDLSDMFSDSCQNNELVAAVLDLSINGEFYFASELPAKIGKSPRDYFNAGFLVMNLSQMRAEGTQEEFHKVLDSNVLAENDQDVLNIVCNDRVQWLPSLFNFQTNHFSNYMWGREKPTIDFSELLKKATLHYTGPYKPWNSIQCISADVWWHYYKQSAFYDYHNKETKKLIVHLLGRLKKGFIGRK